MRSTNNIHSAADCIRTICRHHGVHIGNFPTAHDVDGIIQILKTFDFYAADLHMDMRSLADCPKPVIVQTITGFMTILDANKVSVKITYGDEVHRIAFMDFVKIWTGVVIVIEPPPKRKWIFFKKMFG